VLKSDLEPSLDAADDALPLILSLPLRTPLSLLPAEAVERSDTAAVFLVEHVCDA